MQKDEIYYLLEQYYKQQLTDLEWIKLEHLLLTTDPAILEENFIDLMKFYIADEDSFITRSLPQQRIDSILELDRNIENLTTEDTELNKVLPIWRKWWWSVAALFLFFLGFSWYLYNLSKETSKTDVMSTIVNDFMPGKEGGRLYSDNGQLIDLDTMLGGIQIKRIGDGVYVKYDRSGATYVVGRNISSKETAYHTFETPNGRQYRLELSDGTKIWLNAGSRLKFPVVFNQNSRQVYLTGEAYFEVNKNPHIPFLVNVHGSDTKVEVLGTKFNISSYAEDRGFVTSLLEGKVKIFNDNQSKVLKPGDRAVADRSGVIHVSFIDDPNEETAWKDNYFEFKDADIRTVMNELGRWYDLKIHYQGAIPAGKFSGRIGKELSFNQALEIIGGTDIDYRIDNNKNITIISNN